MNKPVPSIIIIFLIIIHSPLLSMISYDHIPKEYYLKESIIQRNNKTLNKLLEEGFSPNKKIEYHCNNEKYPVEIAILENNLPALLILLSYNANTNLGRPVETAIGTQNIEAIGLILAKEPYKNIEEESDAAQDYNFEQRKDLYKTNNRYKNQYISALIWDVMKGKQLRFTFPAYNFLQKKDANRVIQKDQYVDKVCKLRLFLKKSAKIKEKNDDLNSFLREQIYAKTNQMLDVEQLVPNAKHQDLLDMLDIFIKAELDTFDQYSINTGTLQNNFPIHYVANYFPHLIPYVLEKNAHPNATNYKNITPGHIVTKHIIDNPNDKKIRTGLIKLLQKNTDPTIITKDSYHYSLWTLAARYPNVFTLLVTYCDLSAVHRETGQTALQQLIEYEFPFLEIKDSLKILLSKLTPDQINQTDFVGLTALHRAIILNQLETAKLLLRYKAKTDIKSFVGISPKDVIKSLYRNNKIKPKTYKLWKKIITDTKKVL